MHREAVACWISQHLWKSRICWTAMRDFLSQHSGNCLCKSCLAGAQWLLDCTDYSSSPAGKYAGKQQVASHVRIHCSPPIENAPGPYCFCRALHRVCGVVCPGKECWQELYAKSDFASASLSLFRVNRSDLQHLQQHAVEACY